MNSVQLPAWRHGKETMVLIDAEDLAQVEGKRWSLLKVGYVAHVTRRHGKCVTVYLHRLLMNAPQGSVVDHIDRNPLNNTRANLRVVTQRENMLNTRLYRTNTTGYRGVSRTSGGWRAELTSVTLGVFSTPEAAALAYDEAVSARGDVNAYLNFPDLRAALGTLHPSPTVTAR